MNIKKLFSGSFLKKAVPPILHNETIIKSAEAKSINKNKTENLSLIEEFNGFKEKLLKQGKYISRREYKSGLDKYLGASIFFTTLVKENMTEAYSETHGIQSQLILDFLSNFNLMENIVEQHNEQYIVDSLKNDKAYFDCLLKELDSRIHLDEDQRRVVLTDEDYCLVVAGAGAGKTTTIAAKVKYLVEKKNIDPTKILVVSFTNKAVTELKERINEQLGIKCTVSTFHSVGYAIIKNDEEDKIRVVDPGFRYWVVNTYLKETILKNPKMVEKLVQFFGSYFDVPFTGGSMQDFLNYIAKGDYSTLKSNVGEYSKEIINRHTKQKTTITDEVLKSMEEVEIANFFFMNGIDYEYEKAYKFRMPGSDKLYTPDFYISQGERSSYIEHFGIRQDGTSDRYDRAELERYIKEIADKKKLHTTHGTPLIITYSVFNDKRSLLQHLKEELIKNGFRLVPRSSEEILGELVKSEENKYIRKMTKMISVFIGNFKVWGFSENTFYKWLNSQTDVRTKIFLEICKEVYLEYQRMLAERNSIDFEDMINNSAKILQEFKETKEKPDFEYVIIDEYQDISRQRFDLAQELAKISDAKIMAVGDDWQSIYAFSGSDITLFTDFKSKMGYAKELKIQKTYRNSQEVINIAGNFIQKNERQIKKSLTSPKHIKDPVIIYSFCDDKQELIKMESGLLIQKAKAVDAAIKKIVELNEEEGLPGSSKTLLIGRYGFDAERLGTTGLFSYDKDSRVIVSKNWPDVKLEFLTAHSSKGLGYDNVIIINADDGVYGFPSQIEPDPVFKYVIKNDESIDYAEERRLFYVALTRTYNRVYIITPRDHPSEFVSELKNDYKEIVIEGELNESLGFKNKDFKACPICGFPLQNRNNGEYGLNLYMCTNEPELCNFISNDLSGEKLAISKCDKCDGYLIIKHDKVGNYFLACTEYQANGQGCNSHMSKADYYRLHHYVEGNNEDTKSHVEENQKDSNYVPRALSIDQKKIEVINEKPFSFNRENFKFKAKPKIAVICDEMNKELVKSGISFKTTVFMINKYLVEKGILEVNQYKDKKPTQKGINDYQITNVFVPIPAHPFSFNTYGEKSIEFILEYVEKIVETSIRHQNKQ